MAILCNLLTLSLLSSSLLVRGEHFFRFVALCGEVGRTAIIRMVVEHHLSVRFQNFVCLCGGADAKNEPRLSPRHGLLEPTFVVGADLDSTLCTTSLDRSVDVDHALAHQGSADHSTTEEEKCPALTKK